MCQDSDERATLQPLRDWEQQAFGALQDVFAQRRAAGRVRECHGDLHLGNVTQLDGRPVLFDCLEFSADLRWTDVYSDVAFMAMDLRAHGLDALSHRFVNAYVERSGDADGLRVLRYYAVHRALVRAKVAALRAAQLADGGAEARRSLHHYLHVALQLSRRPTPVLMLTHGFSGSGKTAARRACSRPAARSASGPMSSASGCSGWMRWQRSDAARQALLYSGAASRATHARLFELATLALQAGYPVILDATFLAREPRLQARALAASLGARFAILHFEARPDTLRARVRKRSLHNDDASDADLAVLESQLLHAQPLQDDEREGSGGRRCRDGAGRTRGSGTLAAAAAGTGPAVGPEARPSAARACRIAALRLGAGRRPGPGRLKDLRERCRPRACLRANA